MAEPSIDAAVDELLSILGKSFKLDDPVAGTTLGAILAETIREASHAELPELGSAGDRRIVRRTDEGPLTFRYRPHLFPDMDEALRIGHLVQYHLLPRDLPPDSPVEIAAVLESYCHLSGDLFGWQGQSDGGLILWLIDVSGHGVRAGFAAVVMKLLLADADLELPLPALASRLEQQFLATRQPEDPPWLYATGAFLRIAADGAMSYVSAGHQPLLLRRAGGSIEELEATGMPLALMAGQGWQESALRLEPDDALLLFSDGLVELRNASEELFGEDRAAAVLRRSGHPADIADGLYRAVGAHCDLDRLDDDLSFVVLRRRGDG